MIMMESSKLKVKNQNTCEFLENLQKYLMTVLLNANKMKI